MLTFVPRSTQPNIEHQEKIMRQSDSPHYPPSSNQDVKIWLLAPYAQYVQVVEMVVYFFPPDAVVVVGT